MTNTRKVLCAAVVILAATAIEVRSGIAGGKAPKHANAHHARSTAKYGVASGADQVLSAVYDASSNSLRVEGAGVGTGTAVSLQTNGIPNGSQNTLNLLSGSGITLSNASGTGNVTVSFTGTTPATQTSISHEWLSSYNSSTGAFTASQPSFLDLSGTLSASQLPAVVPTFSGTITAGDCVKWTAAGAIGDAGSACGSAGTAAVVEVNGAPAASQTPMNFQNGGYITVSNPSAGNIQFNFSGPLSAANGGTGLTAVGTSGQVLGSNGAGYVWMNPPNGTVTSVALAAPSIFSVAGSPITASGALTLGLANENANLIFAGPSSGSAAAPTFRALTLSDLPATIAQFSGTITANDCAKWSSSGVLADAGAACGSGGSATPAGANTQVQFNNSGAFGGSANLTWNNSTNTLAVAGTITATSFTTSGGTTAGCVALNELPADGANTVSLCSPNSVAAPVTWTLPSADGTSGQVLSTNGSGALSWITPAGSTGLTSIGISLPSTFTVSSSPLTANGIITATYATQPANEFLAGPSSGSAAAPTFRALTLSDLPATIAQFSGTITANDCAKWSSSGVLTDAGAACGSGGSATPAGANTQVQFNNSGVFGGSANLTWNNSTNTLAVAGTITATSFSTSGGTTAGCVALNELPADGANTVSLCSPNSVAAPVTWTLPSADGTSGQVLSTNGSGALSWITPGGATTWDKVGNAANNLVLSNGTYTTTFDQTGATNWTWANITAATSSAEADSPVLELAGKNWSGTTPASSTDDWTIQDLTGAGTNGANPMSELLISHSGSSTAGTPAEITYKDGSTALFSIINEQGPYTEIASPSQPLQIDASSQVKIGANGGYSFGVTGTTLIGYVPAFNWGTTAGFSLDQDATPSLPIQDFGGTAQGSTTGYLVQSGVGVEYANASTTGTTANTLTQLTGAPSTAVIASAGATSGIVGITIAGAGTTGSARVITSGLVSCVFDGATTAGDYVQASSSTAGDCHDAGSALPTSGEIIGRVLSTNAAAGTYQINEALSNGAGSGSSGSGLPSSWTVASGTNAVTAATASSDTTGATLMVTPGSAAQTGDIFDVCAVGGCTNGKYFSVSANGTIGFSASNLTLASNGAAPYLWLNGTSAGPVQPYTKFSTAELNPPTASSASITSTTAGSGWTAGDYAWFEVTYVNGAGETTPEAAFSIQTPAATDEVTISAPGAELSAFGYQLYFGGLTTTNTAPAQANFELVVPAATGIQSCASLAAETFATNAVCTPGTSILLTAPPTVKALVVPSVNSSGGAFVDALQASAEGLGACISSSSGQTDCANGSGVVLPGGAGLNLAESGAASAGTLACFSASETVGECPANAANDIVGVFTGGQQSALVQTSGIATVNLAASATTTTNDFACSGSVAGTIVDNGSTACPSGQQVGIIAQTNTTAVTSAPVFLMRTSSGGSSGSNVGTIFTAGLAGIAVSTDTTLGYQLNGGLAGSGDGYTIVPVACTAQNPYLQITTAQPSTGTLTATLYVNGTATSVTTSIAAGAAAGTYAGTGTATISAGQPAYWAVTNLASSNSALIGSISLECK